MADAAAVPALRQFPPPPQPALAQQPPLPVPITTPKEVGVVARRAGSSRSIRLATNTAAINRAIVKMIASETTTTAATLIQQRRRRFAPPHTSENVRLSLIAETSTAMRLMQRGRPNEQLVTGRSNGDAYATVYATTRTTR